ncbi:MAG: Trk system potassium transporter TrkA [Candidatus Eisenbacteria bacterium]
MKVIIVGAGEVGFHIANHLSKQNHDIAVIERSPEKHRFLRDKVNALVVLGSGSSAATLEEAGVENADLFIAVTDQDEVNLVACLLAREYNVPRLIARVRTLDYGREDGKLNASKLGIDLLINPEAVVAGEICKIATHSLATEVVEFAGGQVLFIGLKVTAENPVAGVSLAELGEIRGLYRLVVTAISRGEKTIIPRGEDRIQEGDIIYYMCNREDLSSVDYLFGLEKKETKSVFILGGGRIGYLVARTLAERGIHVKVIDRNPDHCRSIAQDLEHVLILNTEGTDVDTLENEGIRDADVYITVTQDDSANILYSLLAKQRGAKRAVALVNHPVLLALAPTLGVDACISPRLATAGEILRYVRKGEVLSLAMVERSDAEVAEFIVPSFGAMVKRPLKDLSFPDGAIIGAVVRGEEVLIPRGDDHLEAGDHVIVFTLPGSIAPVEKFFS